MRKNEEIPHGGLSGQFIEEVRSGFIGIFPLPEEQALARKVFDEYMAAGGELMVEDLKNLKAIVEDNYAQEEENSLLTGCAVEEVRFLVRGAAAKAGRVKKMRQLPRKGSASADASADKGKASAVQRSAEPREEGESVNEFDLLVEHQDALKPARLPSELVCRDEIPTVKPPKKSGVTLTEAIFRRMGKLA